MYHTLTESEKELINGFGKGLRSYPNLSYCPQLSSTQLKPTLVTRRWATYCYTNKKTEPTE